MSKLADPWWRLNNLYKIKDKRGNVVTFRPNWAQKEVYSGMHYKDCILKARQLGMTTLIQLFMLDRCLFNDNQNAGIVAHNKESAQDFFADKIKFAYDHLPDDLKAIRKATSDTARLMEFSNGSKIYVGTSMRSGTLQYLHVSEFGKICAKYPDKAQEVITGSLNTVDKKGLVFVESTAEGPFGEFYDMCLRAQDLTQAVRNDQTDFTPMDYKFFFFPWWRHLDYKLNEKTEITDEFMVYFRELELEHDIHLKPSQKFWYIRKSIEQGDMMKQEYPSTMAEAFERSTELAIYGPQLRKAREGKRICKLPIERGIPVNTFWDIGRNDVNAIWFHQAVGGYHHFIYYFEDRLQDLTYYVEQLQEMKEEFHWFYGKHYLPHDIEVTDLSAMNNKSRKNILIEAGLRPIQVVPRIRHINDGIELTRRAFDSYKFDEEGCEKGLRALHGYSWVYDELHKTTRKTPVHNWASNGADALRQHAQGYRGPTMSFKEQVQRAAGQGNRQYAGRRHGRNPVYNPNLDHVV